jgi:hypothetical protein
MWDPKNDTTEELLRFLERVPLDRMEKGLQDAAREELKRRGVEVK